MADGTNCAGPCGQPTKPCSCHAASAVQRWLDYCMRVRLVGVGAWADELVVMTVIAFFSTKGK